MTDKARELLLQLSQHPSAEESVQYQYSNDTAEKMAEMNALKELQDFGYVIKRGAAIGFMIISITASGKIAAEQL